MSRTRAFFLLIVLFSTSAAAETLYVTDELYLNLTEAAQGGNKLKTLTSGTRLEIIERTKHYAKVRTPDGVVGWVKAAYLVPEKPARLQLSELRKQNGKLEQQLRAARQELDAARQRAETLNDQLASREAALQTTSKLESENAGLRQQIARCGLGIPLPWVLAAAGACLVLGVLGGFLMLDHSIRKRHGGFRIR